VTVGENDAGTAWIGVIGNKFQHRIGARSALSEVLASPPNGGDIDS
jgi:hypothetical protein